MAEEGWKTGGLLNVMGIPAPSGQYRVGCVDLMHQLEGDHRGLLVRLFYPTEATPEEGYCYAYCVPHKNYIIGLLNLPKTLFSSFISSVINFLNGAKMPALEGTPLFGKFEDSPEDSPVDPAPYPVIIFSHGLRALRTLYSAITCDLASHGYVVACVEHRHSSAAATFQRVPKAGGREGELEDQWMEYARHDTPDSLEDPIGSAEEYPGPYRSKQEVKLRADDVKKSLDILTLLNQGAEVRNLLDSSYDFGQFEGRLDISSAAVMGHSYGGATTVQVLHEDRRFKCGLALDSWQIPIHPDIYKDSSSISQPLYFINSYNFQFKENLERIIPLTRPANLEGISDCRVITIRDTEHLNQCDVPFIIPGIFASLIWEPSKLDFVEAHKINMEVCHSFLKRHLLKDPAFQQTVPNLDGTEGHSDLLLFGTNVDIDEGGLREEGDGATSGAAAQ